MLAEFETAHSCGTGFPPVVMGDFNAWPDPDEARQFGSYKTAPAVPGQVFLDVWEYADPAQPSATWNAANPYVAAGLELCVRVDYIPPRGRFGPHISALVRHPASNIRALSWRSPPEPVKGHEMCCFAFWRRPGLGAP
ncbi:endonuclease/exonuclease/phosphatase family protein [Streptomyces sp. NPDC001219]